MKKISYILLVFTYLVFPNAGYAESVSPEFRRIPVGLTLYFAKGSNKVVFEGRNGRYYKTVVYNQDGQARVQNFYNRDGHLVRREFSDGTVRFFKPHHCATVLGECSYEFSSNLNEKWMVTAEGRLEGNRLIYTWTENGTTSTNETVLGQFNIGIAGKSWRVTRMAVEE